MIGTMWWHRLLTMRSHYSWETKTKRNVAEQSNASKLIQLINLNLYSFWIRSGEERREEMQRWWWFLSAHGWSADDCVCGPMRQYYCWSCAIVPHWKWGNFASSTRWELQRREIVDWEWRVFAYSAMVSVSRGCVYRISNVIKLFWQWSANDNYSVLYGIRWSTFVLYFSRNQFRFCLASVCVCVFEARFCRIGLGFRDDDFYINHSIATHKIVFHLVGVVFLFL